MSAELAETARAALAERPSGVYLNNAAEGLLLASARGAWERYARAKSRGARGREEFSAIEHDARTGFAEAIGADAADVAFVASTSRTLDIAISGVDWVHGDALVTLEGEFPSTLFNAELLRRRGVVVRTVAPRDGVVREEDVVAGIDERTRLVVVSLVSFKSGQLLRLEPISRRAREVGALLYVDAVQAVGAVEVTVEHADLLGAATFKWMLGTHGAAGLYASPRARELMRPVYAGYRSVVELFPRSPADFAFHVDARRFEEGMPSFPALAVLAESLRELSGWGYRRIADHNAEAVARLRTGLEARGIRPLLGDASVPTGGIISFETPEFARVARELERRGTIVWARDGRVRLAAHAYTSDDEIDTALVQLDEIGVGA
ncbi:MAG: aminotransferase class V-fold PLP-dependent enzyme [Protaetiibacter sp.]